MSWYCGPGYVASSSSFSSSRSSLVELCCGLPGPNTSSESGSLSLGLSLSSCSSCEDGGDGVVSVSLSLSSLVGMPRSLIARRLILFLCLLVPSFPLYLVSIQCGTMNLVTV